MSRIVGIDLGTTFSLVACLTETGPALIPNVLGDALTPSVVGVDESGHLLVGRPAKELQVLHPERAVGVFKRHMGTEWKTTLGDLTMTPEKLSSLVLRSLKQDAEAHLGETIDQAVITVPAYFNELQRKATIRAGEMAGLKVQRILNEPTAAAIAYGWHALHEDKTIVVLDLGGGTFDVSVVEMFEGSLEVRASSGETFLGGEDFTNALVARVLELQGMRFEQTEMRHPQLISRLRQECEQAKRRLSRQEETTVRVPNERGELAENSPQLTISRSKFEEWTAHILRRIDAPIRRALGDANVKRQEIDELILVGGASRMPTLIQRARELFERDPLCRYNPDEVIAMGAAIQAGLFAKDQSVDDLVVTDVSPFTLGIAISREIGGERQDGYFLPLINRNTAIPTTRVERVSTLHPNQRSITVQVYQGEGRRVADNLQLGEFEVPDIPLGPAGQSIDIRFTYDLNGVLEVEATVVETRKKVSHIITRHAKKLSPAEIQRAVAEMAQLKAHPRDESVNRFLLGRAERLYQELSLIERRFLEQLITGFEEVLELRHPEGIQRNREALEEFLDRYDTEDRNEETYED